MPDTPPFTRRSEATSALAGSRVCMLVFNSLERDPRVWRAAETLVREGASVDIFMLRTERQPATEHLRHGARVHRIAPADSRPGVSGYVRRLLAFLRATQGFEFDVVHCHDGATLPVGTMVARRRRSPIVYDAHEYFPDYLPVHRGFHPRRTWKKLTQEDRVWERLLIRRATAVVTVTESIAALLRKTHRLDRMPVVIPNAVPYWEPTPSPEMTLRAMTGTAESKRLLLYQGLVHPRRGIDAMVQSLTEVENAHLVLLGTCSTEYGDNLRSLSQLLNVQDRLTILEPVPYKELLALTATADVGLHLLPASGLPLSYQYSLPNKLFEYATARLPVVVTAYPEIEAMVEGWSLGVTISKPSPTEVAAAVRRVTDPQWISKTRARREEAARDLCWENREPDLIKIYERLLVAARTKMK